jgi:electron transport complex protein RnfG
MKKKDVKSIIVTAVSLFLICAVSAGLVAFVNSATKDRIADPAAAAENEARKEVLPAAEEFEEITLSSGAAGFLGKAGGETAGYVFTASANGYGGPVKVIVGFAPDGTVTGVKILSLSETPGLGMKAQDENWLEQFKDTDGELKVMKPEATQKNEISALTSATITSKAMVQAVNAARAYFNEAASGEGA